jgi:hypothetical protein
MRYTAGADLQSVLMKQFIKVGFDLARIADPRQRKSQQAGKHN